MSKELPEAKYTKFGEKIRHVIPGPMQCSMACGGRNCKWENPARWSDEDQVIKGVFSSWVLEDVVAMSRPSTEVIMKYDLIKQFKNNDISSIINLQRPGEHASCGPPLHKESQFTYDPLIFMDNDIFFYNFGWKDYGVTSLETILDMVKVMAFTLTEGKVAVHCHAGLGRTGVLIACYLVYAHRMDASSAINTVRKKRPNSIQTRGQIACIQEFAQFLKPLRIVFPQVFPHGERLTLVQFLHRQRHLLHGFESRELRFTPKIVNIICQRLVEIASTTHDMGLFEARKRSSAGPKTRSAKRKRTLKRSNTVETVKERVPGAFVNEHLNSNHINPLDSQELNAILSPRVSRKCDSAKQRRSYESRSLSCPESPVRSPIGAPLSPAKPKSAGPIVVIPPQPVFKDCSTIENSIEIIPSKPQLVLVKQGSSSTKLSLVTSPSQSQASADNNVNNNNQMVPHLGTLLSQSFTICDNPSGVIEDQQVKASAYPPSDIPPLTPSVHEPQLSHSDGVRCQKIQSVGDKPNFRKASAKDQHMVLPTEMPTRGHLGSSKRKLSSRATTTKAVAVENETKESVQIDKDFVHAVAENCSSPDNGRKVHNDDKVHVHDDDTLEMTEDNETDEHIAQNNCKKDYIAALTFDPAAQDLEEITELKGLGGLLLSESQSEEEDDGKRRSKSAASKVSWSEGDNMNGEEKLIHCTGKNEDMSSLSSSSTLLMYRTQKPWELSAKQDSYGAESKSDNGNSERETHVHSDKEDMVSDQLTSVNSNLPELKVRPKSASFLKRLVEKSAGNSDQKKAQVNSFTATQSLCDLRKYDDISCDDLAMMKAEMNSEFFFPISSSTKTSGSDDVCSPTGSTLKRRIKDPITVAMALAYKLTDNEWLWEKVYAKQVELNTRDDAWSSIEQEVDTHLLSCLMWSWIEHLSEPVINMNEVEKLIKSSYENDCEYPDPKLFDEALESLGKPVSSTVHCILHCLSSLPPLSVELELSVIKRMTSAFLQMKAADINKDSDNSCKADSPHEQFVYLIQHYLEEMRLKRLETQPSAEEKERNKSKDISSTGHLKAKATAGLMRNSFGKGEGIATPSTSKVSEFSARITVS